MEAALQPVIDFIARHDQWAGPILGLVIFIESLAIIGAFIPATPMLIATGGLIAAGVIDPVTVLAFALAGAIVGDAVSYSIGRALGPGALRHPALRRHRKAMAQTRLLCRRYGVASIFIGRFFGPLRAFVPLVVGMLLMSRRKFQAANVVSALVWVPVTLAPGYFAAKGLGKLEALGEADLLTVSLIAAALAIVVAIGVWRALAVRSARRASAAAVRSGDAL